MAGLELTTRQAGNWRASVIEAGSGAPVVFLHGSADSAFAWKGVLAELAADFRVCAVDFGTSSPSGMQNAALRLAADRDLLRSLLESFAEPAHVVAHSYGALLAIRGALEDPLPLRSLCLTEPIASGLLRGDDGEHRTDGLVASVLLRFLSLWDEGAQGDAIGVILDYWNGAGSWAATPDAHRERILAGAERFHDEVSCAYEDRTSVVELASMGLPTLVASGANTTEAAIAVCDLIADSVPGARALRVDGAGHSPMRSHPGLFAGALRELFG